MEVDPILPFKLFVLLFLILFNAFFSLAQTSLIALNDKKIKRMADDGHRKAKILYKLLSKPSRFLSTIQIGLTLSGLLASAIAAQSFANRFADYMQNHIIYINYGILNIISILVVTLVLSYFTLVFGKFVPKRIGINKSEKIAMAVARPLHLLSIISYPFILLLTSSTNIIVRLFGIDPNADDELVTEEEIRLMVDVGEEKGVIPENEKIMINNIFDFGNTTVERIMTHRTDVLALPVDLSFSEIVNIAANESFTRLPVYKGTLDDIIGILHIKSLLAYIQEVTSENFNLIDIINKPYFVPQSKMADDLFNEMQKNKIHMAVVVDEYGGTAGIITLEDLIESILGNIQDEYDKEESEIEQIDDNNYIFDGSVDFETICEVLAISIPEEQEDEYDYDTIGGFMMGELDKIPVIGDHFKFNDIYFEVTQVDDKRVVKVKAEKLNSNSQEDV